MEQQRIAGASVRLCLFRLREMLLRASGLESTCQDAQTFVFVSTSRDASESLKF